MPITEADLDQLASRDRFRLSRRFIQLKNQPESPEFAKLQAQIECSCEWVARRERSKPALITLNESLPVSEAEEAIKKAIDENQVVIVAGSTGSGKTTQLPKMCLQMGRGIKGLIGHTQPRRIAARTVAARISEELNSPLGQYVGYQVRFNEQVSDDTYIKLMTDGILLAELTKDRFLSKYDTLIIDEAHERSLNIDFLLGYISQLLPKRPDLKVIITSATIDVDRFAKHFNNAPIIEVSGRTYPVEIRYRPLLDNDEADSLVDAIVQALDEIFSEPMNRAAPDVLIFLSGERDIRELAKRLRQEDFAHTTVLPLYARLSIAEQNKVFAAHTGRRIVLATNVAETSLTVPGIGYVIDPGLARISRYSARSKMQRLPIEPISQASANQRAGRCGRISEGVCIRLYSEEDFQQRPEFTDAEMLRTNLAAVILQMSQLRLGSIENFPLIDKPDSRLIKDGYQLLEELQALDAHKKATACGKAMASLPVDPRLAKIIITAGQLNCLEEILIIVSALAIQDPRERPSEKQQAADEKHRQYWDKESDFLAFVNLWQAVEEQRQELGSNQFQKWCKKQFLSYLRVREWREVHTQLKVALKPLGFVLNKEPASYQAIHTALLSGFLGHIACKDEEGGYQGTRNRKLQLFPGSSLYKKKPSFIMAATILETSQVFAHMVASVERDWVVEQAQHLVNRQAFEPYYHAPSGQVRGFEKITLYGLTLVEKNPVDFSKLDPVVAREIFIRQALAQGQYAKAKSVQKVLRSETPETHFFLHQQRLIEELEQLEAKSRRRDILADEQTLYDFYDPNIPSKVVNLASFEHWRKEQERKEPRALFIDQSTLMIQSAGHITQAQFPNELTLNGITFQVSYYFEPNHPADGVSLHVPVTALHLLPANRLQWLIPGLLAEKCTALIKQLPKQWRKQLVPVPDIVQQALLAMQPCDQALGECLGEFIKKKKGISIDSDLWQEHQLDDYYRFNIKVIDDNGKELDQSRDLEQLVKRYKQKLSAKISEQANDIEQDGLIAWSFDELPETYALKRAQMTVTTYPALVDKGESVSIKLCDNPIEAHQKMLRGLVRLTQKVLKKSLNKQLLKGQDMGLTMVSIGYREDVVDDIQMAAIRHCCFDALESLPRTKAAFEQAIDQKAGAINEYANQLAMQLVEQLKTITTIRKTIKQSKNPLQLATASDDIVGQLEYLYFPGYHYFTPSQWLAHYERYLKAIIVRLEKVPQQVHKDRAGSSEVAEFFSPLASILKSQPERLLHDPAFAELRFMCEEFRVSLFAQQLKTAVPVSAKRLRKCAALLVNG